MMALARAEKEEYDFFLSIFIDKIIYIIIPQSSVFSLSILTLFKFFRLKYVDYSVQNNHKSIL